MDLSKDELDYEEDLDNYLLNIPDKVCAEIGSSSFSGSNDQYLDIFCTEEKVYAEDGDEGNKEDGKDNENQKENMASHSYNVETASEPDTTAKVTYCLPQCYVLLSRCDQALSSELENPSRKLNALMSTQKTSRGRDGLRMAQKETKISNGYVHMTGEKNSRANVKTTRNDLKLGSNAERNNGRNKSIRNKAKKVRITFQKRRKKAKGTNDAEAKAKDEQETLEGLLKDCALLKEDEKELVKMKKEARLKRFMRDEMAREEERSIASGANLQKATEEVLKLGADYFQKMTQQKLAREEFMRLKLQKRSAACDEAAPLEKPNIDKESLLNKVNPFSVAFAQTTHSLQIEEVTKNESRGQEPRREFIETPVKFVRTVSTTNELALGNSAQYHFREEERFYAAPRSSFPKFRSFSLGDRILIGCIVKVLNVPPSITVGDVLALCDPIGAVLEVKLNLPYENSVLIRFAEPKSAEKFFSFYHGQKMENHFLNVIIV